MSEPIAPFIEPILKEDDSRYVMFQFKTTIFGKCIKDKLIVFGDQKNAIYRRIWEIGIN